MENELITVNVEENKNLSITNIIYWEIYIFVEEEWQLSETKEGSLIEVLTYMYGLEEENLGIKINDVITKFK